MSTVQTSAAQDLLRAAHPIADIRAIAAIDGRSSPTMVRLCRLPQVLARIPVSRSAWYAGIEAGRYPRGFNLGPRTTVWRSDDIDALIDSVCQ